ncbi:glycosyltransferase [Bacteroides faecium]|uniref:Glycosyltransferase family 4 protein n=1 Tax=Bacteroides faecium TaxID=2715212 RepID=A0A6H0KR57_9BACE|nr:glycosyltransferase [Bacteroides faecium]QIU95511.1 glycosyltransferase family 4 protein [Bacteroides faecium]
MNILFYFENQINPMYGGTERVADNLAHALRTRGYGIYYLSRRKVGGEYDIPCYFLPDEVGNTGRNIAYINDLINQHQIDIIINEGGNTDDIYLFSKEHFTKVKIITHLHFNPYLQYKYFYRSLHLPFKLFKPVEGMVNLLKWVKAPLNRYNLLKYTRQRYCYMYEHSDRVILLAPSYVSDYLEIAGIEDKRHVCKAMLNPNTYKQTEDSQIKENVVIFVGRLNFEQKRVDYLLDVWKLVTQQIKNWRLEIVGDGPDKERLQEYCKKHQILNVSFEGFKDSSSYYAKAKILTLSSIQEGSPMVIIEAMQHGVVPMLYGTFSASKFLVQEGETGYVIPPFDKQLYAYKMVTLMNNDTQWEGMSETCKANSKQYNIDLITDEWEELLKTI